MGSHATLLRPAPAGEVVVDDHVDQTRHPGSDVQKGYEADMLSPLFARYLPPPSEIAATSATRGALCSGVADVAGKKDGGLAYPIRCATCGHGYFNDALLRGDRCEYCPGADAAATRHAAALQ